MASWSASPSVTLPPALLMYSVIGPPAVAGQLPQALDGGARGVLLDVADEIDVAEPVRLFLPNEAFGPPRPVHGAADR
jgi:hypothetical protein